MWEAYLWRRTHTLCSHIRGRLNTGHPKSSIKSHKITNTIRYNPRIPSNPTFFFVVLVNGRIIFPLFPPAESFQGAPKAGVFSQTLLKALLGYGLKRWPLGNDGFVGSNHQKILGRIFSNIVVGVGYPDKDVEGW